jgi:hypothetical protein
MRLKWQQLLPLPFVNADYAVNASTITANVAG